MPETTNSSRGMNIIQMPIPESSPSLTNEQSAPHTNDQIASDDSDEVVVVVAARFALNEYLKCSAYLCQPDRTFRSSVRMAFYANGKIDRHIPKIVKEIAALTPENIDIMTDISASDKKRLHSIYNRLDYERQIEWDDNRLKVIFLSSHSSPETLVLPDDIVNDLTSQNGKGIAFTQGQRYVSLSRFEKGPKTTSELLR